MQCHRYFLKPSAGQPGSAAQWLSAYRHHCEPPVVVQEVVARVVVEHGAVSEVAQ